MFTALIAFLGSAGLRLALGHMFEALTKWQDQRDERARLELQGQLDAAAHLRNLESLRLQSDLGIKVIEAQSAAHVSQAEAEAFTETVKATREKTGIQLVDAWNGIIRPMLATICIGLWIASLIGRGWKLDDWDRALMSATLGLFVGGRIQATGR